MIIRNLNGKSILRTVVFDVETTGLLPEFGDGVIEIGAVALEQEVIVEEIHSLLAVERSTDPEAKHVHGITEEMLCGQP